MKWILLLTNICLLFYLTSIFLFVLDTAPFKRPDNVNTSQSRYSGVIKDNAEKGQFAVEFPSLNIEKCAEVPFCLPKCCTTRGKLVIIKREIDNEYYAGQFYAYVIRILYGNEAIESIHQSYSCDKIPASPKKTKLTNNVTKPLLLTK